MGIIARQSIRGALANYLGVAIGFFTTFFVLTDCLSQEEIGLTRVMVDAAMLFSGLAQLGTNASIIRFFPFFKSDDNKNHGIFGWSILIPFIGFSILTIFFYLFKDGIAATYAQKSPLMANYMYLLLPLTFFALYLTVFETNASVLMRITVPKIVREVLIRLFNLVCYLLYGNGIISLDNFVLLFCLSYAAAMLINFFYLLTLGRISFRIDWGFINRERLKEIVLYTLFMTATVLAGNIPLINSLFLGAKAGLALTGVYTIAFYIANIVEVPYRSLGAISRPVIAQAVRDNNWDEVNRLGKQVSLHQFIVSSIIFYLIWINLGPLFAVIPHGAEYVGGMGVVFFLGLAKIVNSSLSIGTDILNYSRKYPYALFFIAVLTLSAVLLNNWLITLWGINGSACATLLSYIIYFTCMLLFVRSQLKVTLFGRKHITVLLLILLLFALNYCWEFAVSPLFALKKTLWMMLLEALLRTSIMSIVAMFFIARIHVSDSVDSILAKMGFKR